MHHLARACRYSQSSRHGVLGHVGFPAPVHESCADSRSIQTLLFVLGPIVYPKVRAFYRSHRTSTPPQPLSTRSRFLLNVLFLTGLGALASTYFQPENIFKATRSRLLTPQNVLFERLSKLRPLTADDEVLRDKLSTKSGRLLYTAYGPGPLSACTWCKTDEPLSYLFFALPNMAAAHLAHIVVLGLVTSSSLSEHGGVWRTSATIAGLGLFLAEMYYIGFATNPNAHGTMAEAVWLFEQVRLWRGVAMAAVDGVLGYMLWLSGTRRWTVGLEGTMVNEKIEMAAKGLEGAIGKLVTETHLKQTVMRDERLRGLVVEAWVREQKASKDIYDDEGVKQAKMNLVGRVDMERLVREAQEKSEALVGSISGWGE